MRKYENILKKLPYEAPFLFVDEIHHLDNERVEGSYRFREDEFFYAGHFRGNPVTPGVILTECMAQIGLVGLGIHLLNPEEDAKPQVAFTSSDVEYLKMILPGETVRVAARKVFWRLGKLKVNAELFNEKGELACKGTLSGMIK